MRAILFALVVSGLVATPALACGPVVSGHPTKPQIPPLAASLDELLSKAEISEADRAKLAELRTQITKLARAGKKEEARTVEEQAMKILGFEKAWLRCGPGTFMWMKVST